MNLLDDIVSTTWNNMRRLGPVCCAEPNAGTARQVRGALDAVKLFCVERLAAQQTSRRSRMIRKRKSVTPKSKRTSQPTTAPNTFDAFIAHNSVDKQAVQKIAAYLRKNGVTPWLDKEQIAPGRFLQDAIQEHLPRCKSALIFIGRAGVGRWQTVEIRSLMSRCIEQNIPIIPVLLPRADEIPTELLFLKELQWVKFKRSIDEPENLKALVWGITGRRSDSR